MAPLTQLVGKNSQFVWKEPQQKAFDKLKAIISEETMLRFPNFKEEFVIHTDASDYQLGSVISQQGKPIAFFSRKLNKAQQKYSTMNKELLSIAETLTEYKTLLKGQRITIYTDHKNLTYACTDHTSDRVLRQRLTIDEYGANVVYVKGVNNVVADALSRLQMGANVPMVKCKGKQLPEVFLNRKVYTDLSSDFPLELRKLKEEQDKDDFVIRNKDNPKKMALQECGTDIKVYTVKSKNNC